MFYHVDQRMLSRARDTHSVVLQFALLFLQPGATYSENNSMLMQSVHAKVYM